MSGSAVSFPSSGVRGGPRPPNGVHRGNRGGCLGCLDGRHGTETLLLPFVSCSLYLTSNVRRCSTCSCIFSPAFSRPAFSAPPFGLPQLDCSCLQRFDVQKSPNCLPRCLSGLRHSAHRPGETYSALPEEPRFNPRYTGRFRVRISGAHASRLISQAGKEGSTVSSIICDRWLMLS